MVRWKLSPEALRSPRVMHALPHRVYALKETTRKEGYVARLAASTSVLEQQLTQAGYRRRGGKRGSHHRARLPENLRSPGVCQRVGAASDHWLHPFHRNTNLHHCIQHVASKGVVTPAEVRHVRRVQVGRALIAAGRRRAVVTQQ